MLNPKPFTKVLIVDDSAFIRKALEMMINEDPELSVVGLAKNGAEGVQKAEELKPDVITLDIEMPIMNGLEALEKIMTNNPTPVIMISSLTEEGATVTIKALEIGALDFIPKQINISSTEIIKIKKSLTEKIKNISKLKNSLQRKSINVNNKKLIEKIGTVHNNKNIVVQKTINQYKAINHYEILGIGSSTGGPMALQNVLPFIPENFPIPIVVAQHMPPMFTKSLAKRLNELSAIEILEVENNMTLEKGKAYIGQGGKHFIIIKRNNLLQVKIIPEQKGYLYKPSVDLLFNSLAETCKNKTLGVILTGMGKDGAMGLLNIKNMGGYSIAQDEKTSIIFGMPKAATEIGAARSVLSITRIPQEINRIMGYE